jgi:PEGA domain
MTTLRKSLVARALRIALCLCPLAVMTASAQPAPEEISADDPPGYRALVDAALSEFDTQHYEEGRALLLKAHALHPNARTLRGLGFAEFELRNYGTCVQQLEAALASDVKPLTGELRIRTEQLLARANGFVTRYHLDTRPRIERVRLDGEVVELAPDAVLVVRVGDHTLQIEHPGYVPETRVLRAKGGEQTRLTVSLVPALAAPVSMRDALPPERVWYRRPWLWAGVCTAVAAVAAVAIVTTRDPGTEHAYAGSASTVITGP